MKRSYRYRQSFRHYIEFTASPEKGFVTTRIRTKVLEKLVDADTLKRWMERGEVTLVDVREPAEHRAEHIDGAVSVPLAGVCAASLPARAGKKLVVHCLKGGRGSKACEKLLAEDPMLEVYNLEGGINAWDAAGFPVLRSG
jgi:rhodanese-related sulfurtransferase